MHLWIVRIVVAFLPVCIIPHGAVAASCDPIITFADGKQPLREIFISPSGSNSSGDGSQAKPFQSISRAMQGVRPGDAIRMMPGTYSPGTYIENIAGTAAAPIWIGGVPGQPRPVISGGSLAIHLTRVRYLVMENIEIAGATGNGINCDDGGDYANTNATRHVIFRNLFFRDIGTGGNQDGLKVSGVNAFFVLDCEFARISAGGSGIDHVGCHDGVIARCTFTDMGNSVQCKGGSENIEIRWNRFVNAGQRAINIGGSTGFQFFRPPLSTTSPNTEARNIRVIANSFRGSDAPVAFVGTVNSLVANNTLVEPTRWVLRILQETTSSGSYTFLPCSSNQFANNLVYYNRSLISTHVNVGSNTDAASFEFANNLWYAFDQPSRSAPSLPVAETAAVIGRDPQFKSASSSDYTVLPASPAAAKGKRLPAIKADLLERCFADPPSIGAFEANPPPPPRADSDGDLMPDNWEEAHGFRKDDPSDASLDRDGDGLVNVGEFFAGTDPNDAQSTLRLQHQLAGNEFVIQYPTVAGRLYRIQSRELTASSAWTEASMHDGITGGAEFRQLLGDGKLFRVMVDLTSGQ